MEVATRRSFADLLWVANTQHGPGGHWFARPAVGDEDHDHLRSAEDAVAYLVDHGVDVPEGPPGDEDLADLAAVRATTRGLAGGADGWTAGAGALIERTSFRLGADGELSAEGEGWRRLVGDLLPPLVELARRPARLSTCANPACRLVFLDASKSGTRRWCDDGGCGNRIRLRRHRQRHAQGRPDEFGT